MEDRFKFRAWQESSKHMGYDSFIVYPNGTTDMKIHRQDGSITLLGGDHGFTLMQCTGLKDKNSKLIYEKDKVKTPGGIGIIEYSEGRYIVDYGKETVDELFYFHIDAYNMIEIVGHKYELTKETK